MAKRTPEEIILEAIADLPLAEDAGDREPTFDDLEDGLRAGTFDIRTVRKAMLEAVRLARLPDQEPAPRWGPGAERKQIIEGLKRWALGSYPEQTAVLFLAATNEPLTRVWVRETEAYEDRYWLD